MKLFEEIDVTSIEKEVESIIDEAVVFAQNSSVEPIEDLEKFVYKEEAIS